MTILVALADLAVAFWVEPLTQQIMNKPKGSMEMAPNFKGEMVAITLVITIEVDSPHSKAQGED